MFVLNRKLIFAVILTQTLLAVATGLTVSCLMQNFSGQCALSVGEVDLTGISQDEAKTKAGEFYRRIETCGFLTVIVYGQEFTAGCSDLGLDIEWEQALDEAYSRAKKTPGPLACVKCMFAGRKVHVNPQFFIDKGLLTDWIKGISVITKQKPVNASVKLVNSSVVKTPQTDGRALDTAAVVEKIIDEFLPAENQEIYLDNEGCFKTIPAQTTMDDLKGFDTVISKYSTPLDGSGHACELEKLAQAFNGLVLSAEGEQVFSYRSTAKQELSERVFNEADNQMASTLYAAFLCMGIEPGNIKRMPCSVPRGYAKPGLEACVCRGDLVVKSMQLEKVVVFTWTDGLHLWVYIAGPESDKNGRLVLETNIVEVFDPPVIIVDDHTIDNGLKQTVSDGTPGLKVNVYRTATIEGKKSIELMYTEIYRPVSKVVRKGRIRGSGELQK